MQRPIRIAIVVAFVFGLLAISAGAYAVWTVRRSFPQVDGAIQVPGMAAEVTVYRDGLGVPQLYADTAEDLFRAQGYIHAQDRFWEMDFRRHLTAGRLAELFGADEVETDAFVRTLGWRHVAEQELALLRPQTRRWLDAYATGVNAYLAEHRGAGLSLEYAVLGLGKRGYRPEPWTPVDSIAWLKAMAWDLRANVDDEIDRAMLAAKLPRERVEELYPPYPFDRHRPITNVRSADGDQVAAASVVPAGGNPAAEVDGTADAAASRGATDGATTDGATTDGATTDRAPPVPASAQPVLAALARSVDRLPAVLGPHESSLGSNSWVVTGARTTTGGPLLANDPHLGPSMPGVWYQMGLRCRTVSSACPFDVGGFTFSGMPGVIIGHNSRIAWGLTNLGADVADLYVERLRGDRYQTPSGYRDLVIRTETIGVAGDDPVTIQVRSTRHGPLLSDVSETYREVGTAAPASVQRPPPASTIGVALRWTALDRSRTIEAVFAIDHATDWASFRAAARLFTVPAQNLVYADRRGNIGYQTPGTIPVRARGDGRWPVPGWSDDFDWTSTIPFDELPSVINPREGYIVTANNAVTPRAYPRQLTRDWDYGYRSQRIVDLIEQRRRLSVADMERIQLDTHNANAEELVPYLMHIEISDPWFRDGQDLLRGWDYSQLADSGAAAYFNGVWRSVLARTFEDELTGDQRPDGGSRWFEVMRGLLADPDNGWWDDVRTPQIRETRDIILGQAMRDARNEMTRLLGKDPARWRWGRAHALQLESQAFGQSGIGVVEWMFNRGPYDVGGGDSTVDATGWTASGGYHTDWVPSMRMVVNLASPGGSRWVNLTGASGHAFHQHYVDQVEMWRAGRSAAWPWRRSAVEETATHTLRLVPRPSS
jgi:penicillin amidase